MYYRLVAFYLAFFLLNNTIGYSQDVSERLKSILTSADSIILVSHKETFGITIVDDINGRVIPLPKLLENGKLNDSIIIERSKLGRKDLDTLIHLLNQKQIDKVPFGKCFIPHQALLIVKNQVISYLDICFGCSRFITSKNLRFVPLFDERKWDRLEEFFISRGLTYELK